MLSKQFLQANLQRIKDIYCSRYTDFSYIEKALSFTLNIQLGSGGKDAMDIVQIVSEKYKILLNSIVQISSQGHAIHFSDLALFMLLRMTEEGTVKFIRFSNAKRHTSFYSVYLSLQVDNMINITVKDCILEMRKSGGPGGQHSQKRNTAVTLTYKPLNLKVRCSDQRSMELNCKLALQEINKRANALLVNQNKESNTSSFKSVAKADFSSQYIRIITINPEACIKDSRFDIQISTSRNINNIDIATLVYKVAIRILNLD